MGPTGVSWELLRSGLLYLSPQQLCPPGCRGPLLRDIHGLGQTGSVSWFLGGLEHNKNPSDACVICVSRRSIAMTNQCWLLRSPALSYCFHVSVRCELAQTEMITDAYLTGDLMRLRIVRGTVFPNSRQLSSL